MAAHKKRRKPIIEEIVETPASLPKAPEPEVHTHHHVHEEVEETAPVDFVETAHEVASYDEPTPVDIKAHAMPDTSQEEVDERKTPIKLLFAITIITALVVGFILGGVYVYMSGVKDVPQVTGTPTPSAQPQNATPAPTPTPQPVKLNTLKVNVLNGSGIIGAAGKVKTALETAGFVVPGTGNASNYAYKKTVIQVKDSVPVQVVDSLKEALKAYSLEDGDKLPASSTYDIVVIAGRD